MWLSGIVPLGSIPAPAPQKPHKHLWQHSFDLLIFELNKISRSRGGSSPSVKRELPMFVWEHVCVWFQVFNGVHWKLLPSFFFRLNFYSLSQSKKNNLESHVPCHSVRSEVCSGRPCRVIPFYGSLVCAMSPMTPTCLWQRQGHSVTPGSTEDHSVFFSLCLKWKYLLYLSSWILSSNNMCSSLGNSFYRIRK